MIASSFRECIGTKYERNTLNGQIFRNNTWIWEVKIVPNVSYNLNYCSQIFLPTSRSLTMITVMPSHK